MNYSINNFFEKEECKSIIEFAENNGIPFSYNPTELWDCKRIYDEAFKLKIKNKFLKLYNNGDFKLWFNLNEFKINDINVSLTKYYENRWLDLHLDSTSQFTTVIVLSDDFNGGDFALSEKYININECKKYKLNIGESISFDGSKTFHGVVSVSNGIRYALNIWMTDTKFKYYKLNEKKKLI